MLMNYILLAFGGYVSGHPSGSVQGEHVILRLDQSNSNIFDKTPAQVHSMVAFPRLISQVGKALAPEEAFKVNLEKCDAGASTCELVLTALQNAGRRIAENLLITNQITISAKFVSFCNGRALSQCPLANTLGSAIYGSAFVVKDDSEYFIYNQALIKQLDTDVEPSYGDVDLIAEFNSDANWFFRGRGSNSISPDQSDFEYVASHELTHGLGFGSGVVEYSTVFNGTGIKGGYLAPLPLDAAEDPNFNENTIVSALEPIDIFDSFISGSDANWKELGKDISNFGIRDTGAGQFIDDFQSSKEPFQAAQKLYRSATKGTGELIFTTNSGLKVPLYSPTTFQQGSSISHVELSQASTDDFLMIPALAPGITLESVMQTVGTTKLYGKGVAGVMESIGWSTNENPKVKKVQLSLRFKGDPNATGAAVKVYPFTLIGVICTMFMF